MQKKFKPYRDGTSSSSDDDEIGELEGDSSSTSDVSLWKDANKCSVMHVCGGMFIWISLKNHQHKSLQFLYKPQTRALYTLVPHIMQVVPFFDWAALISHQNQLNFLDI